MTLVLYIQRIIMIISLKEKMEKVYEKYITNSLENRELIFHYTEKRLNFKLGKLLN